MRRPSRARRRQQGVSFPHAVLGLAVVCLSLLIAIAAQRRGRSAAPIPAGSPGHRREPSPTRTATRTTTSKVVYYAGRRIGIMTADGRVQLDSNAHIPG